jgi:hypothetical protein
MDKEHLKSAARAVEAQTLENPELGIPVDPDVAEFMGAFREAAVSPEDFDTPEREEPHGH